MARKKISIRAPKTVNAVLDAALFIRACQRTGGKLSLNRKRIVCLLPKGVKRFEPIPKLLDTLSGVREDRLVAERARHISPVPRLFQ